VILKLEHKGVSLGGRGVIPYKKPGQWLKAYFTFVPEGERSSTAWANRSLIQIDGYRFSVAAKSGSFVNKATATSDSGEWIVTYESRDGGVSSYVLPLSPFLCVLPLVVRTLIDEGWMDWIKE
jgi:hypothetical protein